MMPTSPGPAHGYPPGTSPEAPPRFRAVLIAYAVIAGMVVLGGFSALGGLLMARSMTHAFSGLPTGGAPGVQHMQERMLELHIGLTLYARHFVTKPEVRSYLGT